MRLLRPSRGAAERAAPEDFADFDFITADSTPRRFAVRRPWWLPGLFLLSFALLSLGLLLSVPLLEPLYRALLGRLGAPLPETAFPVRLRPFFVTFFVTFCLFAAGPLWRRLRALLSLLALFALGMLLLDLTLALLAPRLSAPSVALIANVSLGFIALAVFVGVVLHQGALPQDERVPTLRRRPKRYALRFALALLLSALLAGAASVFLGGALDALRAVGLLGGLGPGVVLFFPLFIGLLALWETLSLRREDGDVRFSVAFLVPALNEAEHISACIRSLDLAAQRYGRVCTLVVVDNGSSDATAALAAAELARAQALTGQVLSCLTPGKSKALNAGLRHIREDIVVRIDADTQVSPELLVATVPHFTNPAVGAVSGLPLPRGGGLLGKLRAVEVYQNQGFVRLGMSALDAVLSMTGVFSAYRRGCLDLLGGFVEEINGEDTDIVLRIGRLGYRLVNDPSLLVYSDTPKTVPELREQRLRWFRSTFHVAARNRSAFWQRQGIRGWFSLPWALLQNVRRALMVPVLVYAGVVALVAPNALFLRGGAAALAVVVGLPFLVTVLVTLAYRRFDLLPYLPPYLGFRLLRSYFNLEMLFTLPLGPASPTQVTRGSLGAEALGGPSVEIRARAKAEARPR